MMTRKGSLLVWSLAPLGLVAILWVAAVAEKNNKTAQPSNQQETEKDAVKKESLRDKDSDASTINVSSYPKVQQENYKVFAAKCSRCHAIALSINAPYALPEEWDSCVQKMLKKKRSGLNPASAKKIIEFLTYDSSVRKKDLIEEKLKEKEAQTP